MQPNYGYLNNCRIFLFKSVWSLNEEFFRFKITLTVCIYSDVRLKNKHFSKYIVLIKNIKLTLSGPLSCIQDVHTPTLKK